MNLSGGVAVFERSPDWLHNCIALWEREVCIGPSASVPDPAHMTTPLALTDKQDSGQEQGHVDEELCKPAGGQGRVTRRCICDSVEHDHGDNI